MSTKDSTEEIIRKIRNGNSGDLDYIYSTYRKEFLTWGKKNFREADFDMMIDAWQNAVVAFYQQIMSNKLMFLTCEIKTYLFLLAKRYLQKELGHNIKTINLELQKLERMNIETQESDEDDSYDIEKKQMNIAMTLLGIPCQQLLKYKFVEDLSIEEIRIKAGYQNVNTVSASISRCLRTLKEILTESVKNEG
jgi:hypothetical protein